MRQRLCFACDEWSDARDFVSACPKCHVPRGTTKAAAVAHNVMPDIAGYQSQVTGEWIGSRSRHREHLKDHGMIEIGNELKYLQFGQPTPETNKQREAEIRADVIKACYQTGYWK